MALSPPWRQRLLRFAGCLLSCVADLYNCSDLLSCESLDAGVSNLFLSKSPLAGLQVLDLHAAQERGLASADILDLLVQLLGHEGRVFLDLRAGPAVLNDAGLAGGLWDRGWRGLLVGEVDRSIRGTIWREKVRPVQLDELLDRARAEFHDFGDQELDVLHLDANGGEYQFYQALGDRFRPRLVLVRADLSVPPWFYGVAARYGSSPHKVATGPDFQAFSAAAARPLSASSMKAMSEVLGISGYSLVHAFEGRLLFVRRDVLRRAQFGLGLVFARADDLEQLWLVAREAQQPSSS